MKSFLIKSAALAALTVISAVSCTKEQNVDASVSQPELHFIIKTAESTPVKSFIENNLDGTYTPKWTNGDELAIFIGDITNSTTAPTATLPNIEKTGLIAKFDGTVSTDKKEGSFLSFSPAGAFAKGYTDGTVGINLSNIQSPSSLTIDEACDVLVARPCYFLAENGNVAINDLFFKRIFSIVKVNLNGADALNGEKVTSFTLNAPVTLTGCAAVDLSTASFSKWNVENKSVTANYSEDWPVFGGVNGLENTIWLVVNPTTVANGSTVTFSGETENYTFSKEVNLSKDKDLVFPQSQIAVINLTIGEGNYIAKTVYSWDLSVDSTSEATEEKISWSNSVAEMVCVKGESTTDANHYYPGVGQNSTRFYKNSTLTITPKNGKQLTYYIFEAITEGFASALSNSKWTNAEVTVEGTTVKVIAEDPSSAVSCVISDYCGFTKVECHTDAAPVLPPSISVTAASLEVPAAGGKYRIEYVVKHPIDEKSISATSNQTWVNNFDYSTSGQVSFVVDKNAGKERTASIKLSYEGAEDVTVSVTQAAAGSASKKTVTYTVTSTSAVTASDGAPSGSSATYSSTYNTAKQLTGGYSMTLTLSGYQGMTVKGLTLSMKSNSSSGAGYLSVKAGDQSLGSIGSSSSGVKFNTASWYGKWSTSYVDVKPKLSNTAYTVQSGEDIVIVIGATTNSLYCQSFTIEYEQGGSSEGGSTGGETPLDYTFATSKSQSNTAYDTNYDLTISGIEWSVPGNQNFSGYVRIGGKNLSNTVRYIYSKKALPSGYKTITMSTKGKSNSSLAVGSVVCKVYSSATGAANGGESNLIATMTNTDSDWAASTAKTIVFTDESSADGSQRYYRFEFTLSNSTKSNYGIDLQKIVFSAN